MPGPTVTPATPPNPAPVAPVVVSTDPIKPEPAPSGVMAPQPTNEGTAVSTNVAGSIIMPAVVYTPPAVFGVNPTDRGDEAAYVVNHYKFGEFVQGSRISAADIVNAADIPAFIKMGAISELPRLAASTPEPAPATDPDPKPKGK